MRCNNEQTAGINKLVKRNFKTQKWKNVLLIFVILLIACFFTCLTILKYNEYKNLERYAQHMNGTSGEAVFQGLDSQQAVGVKDSSLCDWVGESIFIAEALNQELGNQYTEIRYADQTYAEAYYAKPMEGNMPVDEEEIAVGKRTLNKLGIRADINETVNISWMQGEQIINKKFKLVGYWEEDPEVSSNYIWVSSKFSQTSSSGIDLTVSFHNSDDKAAYIEKLASEFGIDKSQYTLVQINRESIIQKILLDLNSWIALGVVLLIGVLILNSIQQISVASNLTFYGRIKAMGAEERQIRHILWFEMVFIATVSLPIGILLGYYAGIELTPVFVNGSLIYTQTYFNARILIIPVVLTCIAIVVADIGPIRQAGKTDIDTAFKYKGYGDGGGPKEKKYPGAPILVQMSFDNLSRYKKRTVVGICMLVIGLVWMSCFFAINIGFDQEKFLKSVSISDFVINSGDLSRNTIGSSELGKYAMKVRNTGGITGTGELYLRREDKVIPDAVYQNIVKYYEANKKQRLEYMQYDTLWMEQYEDMYENHECKYQIWGIDGLLIEKIMQPENLIKGSFNEDKFRSGKYVIAEGISGDQGTSETEPTYSPGDTITIEGKEYEIMAVAEIPSSVKQDVNDAVSGFKLSFYMPNEKFHELFHDIYPQKLFFNTSPSIIEKTEDNLILLEKNKGFQYLSQNRLIADYKRAVISQNGIEMLIGGALIGIGLIQMLNSIVSSIIARRREFILMGNIGMTQKQIRYMLMFEALDCIFITLVLSFILSIFIITTFIKSYVDTQWASTFNFSITPLLVMTPFLILFAVIVPVVAYRLQKMDKRENVRNVRRAHV